MGTEEAMKDMDTGNWLSKLEYEQWVAAPVSGPRPLACYKHAAAVADEKLYVVGGSRNGRYQSDVQVFDLKALSWSMLKPKPELHDGKVEGNGLEETLSAMSDHSMEIVKWGNKLLILGGHSKKTFDSMIVWYIDLETQLFGILETSGKAPVARGGHSATLVGSRLMIFGGEDGSRRLMNDVYALDLETRTWDVLDTMQTSPAPRFDHTAAIHAERYLLIFGGCSHSIFFDDLHVLDLQTDSVGTKPEDVIQHDLHSTWKAMEAAYDSGKTRAIGVSNHSIKKLDDLLSVARVPPAVNQVEIHPVWKQTKLHEFCKSKGVHLTEYNAYSPLGSPGTGSVKTEVLKNPNLKMVAEKLGKSPAQVALRWGLQMDHSVIPKSTSETRIKENFDLFGWSIPDDLMPKISEMPQERLLRGDWALRKDGPYKTLEELWDGEI